MRLSAASLSVFLLLTASCSGSEVPRTHDMRHMPRVRAVTDTVVEALRKNAAILNPGH